MKKLFLLLAITGFFVQSYAQDLSSKEVPAAVTTAFFAANPSITDVDWTKDGPNYKGAFVTDKVINSATYDFSGNLINTQLEIVPSALPVLAMDYVKINFKNNDLKNSFKVTDADEVVTYSTQVDGTDLTFDSEGNFINSVKN